MGANPWRDVSPPIIRQHPSQYFHFPKLGISERDDLFFGRHFILGKKLGIWERYDLSILVFTSFWAKNWASADVSILLHHPPDIEKWSILLNHLPQCST